MAIAGSNSHTRALFACLVAAVAVLVLPTPSEAAGGSRLDRVERRIIRKINRIRAAHGLPAVRANHALARSADAHCADMLRANFFAHSSSNGEDMAQRVESYRRSSWVGETLAYVPTRRAGDQAARIVSMWMHSPPHRASLLTPQFRRIGVARRRGTLGRMRAIVFTADLASKH